MDDPAAERVLVIDDDEGLLEVCRFALRQAGYQVTVCAEAGTALKLIDAEDFDLVLTDLVMPGSADGQTVVSEVRTRHPDTEVIVLTGVPTLKTAIDTLKAGAWDYVVKPFSPEHLKLIVRRCLDYRKAREALRGERALRRELESAYGELQKVERLKASFVSRASHELRTPMSEVLVSLRLLEEAQRRGAPIEECRKLLALSLRGAERLEKTVFDLLAFSDLQTGKTMDLTHIVNPEVLCRRVAEKLRPMWEPRQIQIDVRFEPQARTVLGDPDALEKAFEHLLHNAIVFNREGGRIGLEGSSEKDRVTISFSDSGEGIPEAEFGSIFDGFYQIANYLTRKVQGLGLGLATTRAIIEAHGGEIRVSSRLGEGTTFAVTLPAATSPPRPTAREAPAGPGTAPAS